MAGKADIARVLCHVGYHKGMAVGDNPSYDALAQGVAKAQDGLRRSQVGGNSTNNPGVTFSQTDADIPVAEGIFDEPDNLFHHLFRAKEGGDMLGDGVDQFQLLGAVLFCSVEACLIAHRQFQLAGAVLQGTVGLYQASQQTATHRGQADEADHNERQKGSKAHAELCPDDRRIKAR